MNENKGCIEFKKMQVKCRGKFYIKIDNFRY